MKKVNSRTMARSFHEKMISWFVYLVAPVVFYFGSRAKPWNLTVKDLLGFPEGSLGRELGKFYDQERLDPIPRAEFHDVFHVLFGFSTSLKDEVALQYFLRGNGKNSLASLGTALGAWIIFPRQRNYFKTAYERGQHCIDINGLDLQNMLGQNIELVRFNIINPKYI